MYVCACVYVCVRACERAYVLEVSVCDYVYAFVCVFVCAMCVLSVMNAYLIKSYPVHTVGQTVA